MWLDGVDGALQRGAASTGKAWLHVYTIQLRTVIATGRERANTLKLIGVHRLQPVAACAN